MSGTGTGTGQGKWSGYNYGAIFVSCSHCRPALRCHGATRNPTARQRSLVGRIDKTAMGSRAFRESAPDAQKKKQRVAADPDRLRKKAADAGPVGFGFTDIIEATQDVEGLTYRPRTKETAEVYEMILSSVHVALGDQAQDIVRSAADTVLETLKSDTLKDFDKKKEIELILGSVSGESLLSACYAVQKDHGLRRRGHCASRPGPRAQGCRD